MTVPTVVHHDKTSTRGLVDTARKPRPADPVAVEWSRYMTANDRAHDDYTSRQTGRWPCRRCRRVFRHPLPRARHICSGVNGDALLSFPPGTCVVPDDPKALTPPAPVP